MAHRKHFALTRRQLHDAESTIHRATSHLRRTHERQLRMQHSLVEGLEVGGTLFGWGLVHGRFGVLAPMGISVDMIAGLLLGLAGAFELGGERLAPHLVNLGVGSLGAFLMRKGVQAGTAWRTSANLPPLATFNAPDSLGSGIFGGDFARQHGGMPVANAGRELSDAELAAMQRSVRHAA